MTKEEILKWYNDEQSDTITGSMYGFPTDRFIEIEKSSLILDKNNEAFIHIWGWPGPDFTLYYFKDYGKTWYIDSKEMTNVSKC